MKDSQTCYIPLSQNHFGIDDISFDENIDIYDS